MNISETFSRETIMNKGKSFFDKKKKELRESKIALAIGGDKEAFSYIIQENIDGLYVVAKGILNKEEDIEDAFQNTVIKAYENIGKLKHEEFFKTWITRILINECNKVLKKNKKVIHLEDLNNEIIHHDKETNIDLINAVNSLSEDLKITTWLFYFKDISIENISKTLMVPKGTVKSRLARSREKLYKIINNN